MQSSDLANLLNFKERGPRLFDEDGRETMTEKIKEKYPEDATGEKNIKKDVLGKQYTSIQSEFTAYLDELREGREKAQDKAD